MGHQHHSAGGKRRGRPSPATVISTLALFVALSGSVYAATAERNSVASKSIRNGAIKGVDVKPDTLKGAQIDERSLELAGLTGAQGPEGPRGPVGPPGPSTGPAGGDLAGSYPNPSIAAGAVGSPEVANDSLGGTDVNEVDLALPTAWASIADPDGAGANPTVLDGEGIVSVNDGPAGGTDGIVCFDLAPTPTGSNYDLVTVTDRATGSVDVLVSGDAPAGFGCTGPTSDAMAVSADASTGALTGEDLFVSFWDL